MARKPTGKPPGRPRLSEEEKAKRADKQLNKTQKKAPIDSISDGIEKTEKRSVSTAEKVLPQNEVAIQTVRTDTEQVRKLEQQLAEEREKKNASTFVEPKIHRPTESEEPPTGFFKLDPTASCFYRK